MQFFFFLETNGCKTGRKSVCVNIYKRPGDGVLPFGVPPTGRHGEASQKQSKLHWDSSSSGLTVLPQPSRCSSKAPRGNSRQGSNGNTLTPNACLPSPPHIRLSWRDVWARTQRGSTLLCFSTRFHYSINFESLTRFVSSEFPPAASSHFRAFVKTLASHFFDEVLKLHQ